MASPPSWSTDVHIPRTLIGESLGYETQTIAESVIQAATERPNHVQYITAEGKEYTMKQFYDLVRKTTRACIHLGLKPETGVSILGFNSVEWFAIDVAANFAAAYSSGIYISNSSKIVAHIVNHSNSHLIFVDNQQALEKVLSIVSDCKNLKNIIVWGEVDLSKYDNHDDMIMSWNDFLNLAENVPDDEIDKRIQLIKPESIAKLIYTSGTTGPPKAVMISHDNSTWTSRTMGNIIGRGNDEHIVSFLPSSHVAANSIDINGAIINKYSVYFASPDALRGSLVETLRKVRPTVFLAVPRVFEKIHEKMLEIGAQNSKLKQWISAWAKDVGARASDMYDAGDSDRPMFFNLANSVIFNAVKKNLGLDRCRLIVNASAPLQKSTDEYFRSLFIRIVDLYGMSEATGPLTANFPDFKRGTSGKPVPGVEFKLFNADESGEGELCFRGRNIFVGYLGNEEETRKALDDEGFIHSGDLGKVDEDGFITVTGRAKELIVTAGGENVAPTLSEAQLISAMPAILRAVVVGDKKKFISCLLIPYMEEDGTLTGPAKAINPNVKKVTDIASDTEWNKYIEQGINMANEHAISNAAKIRKFRVLTRDFTIEAGELTPTLKAKRKIVVKNFSAEIESMYETQ